MLVARVDEQVGVGAGVYTSFHERQGVLRHASVVMVVMDNQQMTFQLTREVFQVAFLVTFRIGFRCVHIAFAVHHFIISPVDDRTTGYAYFEYFRVTEQQGSGHVPSKAPAVHADASAVYVREGFQEFDTFYLVFAFFNAEATEGGVLKLQSAVTAATIVNMI